MASDAWLGTGFAQLKLSGDCGITYFLPWLIGVCRTRSWLLCPRRVEAAEALALGLTGEVVPSAELDVRVRERAEQLVTGSPVAAQVVRRRPAGTVAELRTAVETEFAGTLTCNASAFHADALAALWRRRQPVATPEGASR